MSEQRPSPDGEKSQSSCCSALAYKNKVCQNSNSGEPRKIAFRTIHKSMIPKASLQGLLSAIHSPGPVSYLNSDTLSESGFRYIFSISNGLFIYSGQFFIDCVSRIQGAGLHKTIFAKLPASCSIAIQITDSP